MSERNPDTGLCVKEAFETIKRAGVVILAMKRRKCKGALHPYKCSNCGMYHITSQRPKKIKLN